MAGSPQPREVLEPGDRVEVRTGFDRSWTSGFVVETSEAVGYTLRRSSDDAVLPAIFPGEDVRRERKSNLWWF